MHRLPEESDWENDWVHGSRWWHTLAPQPLAQAGMEQLSTSHAPPPDASESSTTEMKIILSRQNLSWKSGSDAGAAQPELHQFQMLSFQTKKEQDHSCYGKRKLAEYPEHVQEKVVSMLKTPKVTSSSEIEIQSYECDAWNDLETIVWELGQKCAISTRRKFFPSSHMRLQAGLYRRLLRSWVSPSKLLKLIGNWKRPWITSDAAAGKTLSIEYTRCTAY